jgi:hypothetical protein
MAPIITGIRVTYETGQFAGNWGNPTDGPGTESSSVFSPGLMVLAPNPCVGKCPVRYVLARASSVRLWVTPARLAGALGTDMESMLGMRMAAPRMAVVKTLDSGTMRPAGVFTADWDATDDAGNPVPSGFYRIFLSIDNTFYWRDLLLFATDEEAERAFPLNIND